MPGPCSVGCRPAQQDHATAHTACRPEQPVWQRNTSTACSWHAAQRGLRLGSERQRRRRNGAAAATGASAEVLPPPEQAAPGGQAAAAAAALQLVGCANGADGLQPGGGAATQLDASLAKDDGDVVNFMFHQYHLYERRQAKGSAARALSALQAAQPGAEALSLRRDVLPKLELLEAISPGLGWRVFRRWPEEFGSPEAVERWRLAAAYLFTVGVPPEEISRLFARHAAFFRVAVARPDALRRLFDWMAQDLQLAPQSMLKLINRCPAVVQADVDTVLKPRLRFFTQQLGLSQERAVTGLLRCPEALGVDTAWLAQRADFFCRELGMTPQEVGALFVREPSAVMSSLERLQQTVDWLRQELGLGQETLCKVVAKGGATKYPLTTLQARVAAWTDGLGFSPAELGAMLGSAPRLLLYPLQEPKYQAKLAFLKEELGLPLRALLSFPAYLTYSLAGRIAPRAAAARALGDRPLPLPKLAMTDEAFARWLGVEAEEWEAWLAAWRQGVDTQRWKLPPACRPPLFGAGQDEQPRSQLAHA
ncbi:mTERF domain-containing mitochondrial [Micractinium conductrix]|uniref:mTERF domain-containing mitochondrial n=1 Tax=Micractinium conductrix TaxID=554055 RepID=A0A2P6VBP0_9CHLO|nr:mTERF domain-containing mitochondrial [Micractinium conductrix]|eukprot:PSC71512.1 mTERF domain-containing mitochondrial [Micractinium conductrix]